MMEFVEFISQDIEHFVGFIIAVIVIGAAVEGIIKEWKKKSS